MTTLREQIEALTSITSFGVGDCRIAFDDHMVSQERVLDIIDQHDCRDECDCRDDWEMGYQQGKRESPDRDALARALHRLDGLGMSGLPTDSDQCWHEDEADAIIATLKGPDAKD